ncbi:MAG TPA: sulfite exporter TauE/SafE family protein [Rikenellaceae bacterium]|mgnify:FL=1|nr:sulfite exporter TauE/SafE family protein [Rikenellaceae bacterium]
MYLILILVGFIAGLLSGSVGFGGGMILLPVITYFYGVEVAVPVSTIAQLLSNLSRVGMGWKEINWKAVWRFLMLAVPFTILGAFGFAKVPKDPMTKVLCSFLIVFAFMKLMGKMRLPNKPATMIVGGGVTGFVNGLLGISGPLSSAVFLSLELAPVSYIASEATAAAFMHIVKAIVYGKLNLMSAGIFLSGCGIGCAMILGNFIAMRCIRNVNKKLYQKIVAGVMIAVSLWMIVS